MQVITAHMRHARVTAAHKTKAERKYELTSSIQQDDSGSHASDARIPRLGARSALLKSWPKQCSLEPLAVYIKLRKFDSHLLLPV